MQQSSSSSSLLQLNSVPFYKGDNASIRLLLPCVDGQVRSAGGRQLRGSLVVRVAGEAVTVVSVRVVLRCKESVLVESAFEGRHTFRWFEMSTFVHMPDQDAHEEASLEPGEYSYPFELKVPEGAPPSLQSGPADEDLHGDEAEPWLRTFFQDLKGTFRVRYLVILKDPLEERMALSKDIIVSQPPSTEAMQEYAKWNLGDVLQCNVVDAHALAALAAYQRAASNCVAIPVWQGPEVVLEKRPWMYRGSIKVTALLNKSHFLLQGPPDPVMLRISVDNSSSRAVKCVSAALVMELVSNGLSRDNVPISEHCVETLDLEGLDFENIASEVGPDSERGFTWALRPKKLHLIPPSAVAKHFEISYRVDGEIRFSGAVLPLRFSLPFRYHVCVGDISQVL